MTAIDLPIDADDPLYDPPVVDLLYRVPDTGNFVITFVPSDDVSSRPTESVRLSQGVEYKRVVTFYTEACKLLRLNLPDVERIVHGGGGDFTIRAHDRSRHLSEWPNDTVIQVADRFKQIANEAEIAFRINQRHAGTAS